MVPYTGNLRVRWRHRRLGTHRANVASSGGCGRLIKAPPNANQLEHAEPLQGEGQSELKPHAITLGFAMTIGLFLRPSPLAQAPSVQEARTPTDNLFAGTWELEAATTQRNCPILQFAFAPTTVTVRCSDRDASLADAATSDVYEIESVYSNTRHPGSFNRVLLMARGRILEFHEMEGGMVVRVRWFEVSEDGQRIIATTKPTSRPRFYRQAN